MLKKTEKALKSAVLGSAIAFVSAGSTDVVAGSLTQALKTGKASGLVTVRREVNNTSGGNVVNVRSRIGYTTGGFNGFSATLEMEDSRFMFGEDENVGILEQEFTEVEQAFIKYKDTKYGFTAKLGRQVIALDGQRHIGHVGWRLDRQTYDTARVTYSPIEDLTIDYSYVYKVNRINSPTFADVDVDSNLLNISYKTPVGKVKAYSYMLSEDGLYDETNTYGVSFGGSSGGKVKALYNAEFAIQENVSKDLDTEYLWLEGGVSVYGYTGKLGYEILGSDSNGTATASFETPYATVHKFAGWADVFAGASLFGDAFGGVGLVDTYASFATKKFGPKIVIAYHVFEPEESTSYDRFGDELDILIAKPVNKVFSVGAKAAKFNGRSDAPTGDKEVFWFWVQAKI